MNKRKRTKAAPPPPPPKPTGEDATPERLAHANDYCALGDGTIDKAGERPPLVRRFSDTHIDRMKKRGQLTYAQWFAGDWFRTLHAQAITGNRVVANYGEGIGGAGAGNYGQPRSETQAAARQTLRRAREVIPANMLNLVEKLIVEDIVPALGGGVQRDRYAKHMASALQPLAEWMHAPGAT